MSDYHPSILEKVKQTVSAAGALHEPVTEIVDCEKPPGWFHEAQECAWESDASIIAVVAGWQSGKTVILPHWLLREIQRCGPGDYGAFSTTYRLLERKFRPELAKVFKPYAEYKTAQQSFVFTAHGSRLLWGDAWNGEPTIVQTGYAENPDSLESATLKAVAWDEPGQRIVPEQSFKTVQSRLMVNRGRMILASRPYEFNWFEKLVREHWFDAHVINFPSWLNPVNPDEDAPYWDELRKQMPEWQFAMLYEGVFTRPAGLVFDCLDPEIHLIDDVPIDPYWQVYVGVDFGDRNTAAVLGAWEPASTKCPWGRLHIFGTYHKAEPQVSTHVRTIKRMAVNRIRAAWGGASSENEWRRLFGAAGLSVGDPPVSGVAERIDVAYSKMKQAQVVFHRRAVGDLWDDLMKYSYEIDDDGNPIQGKIADKAKWHKVDALCYLLTGRIA